MGGRRVAVAAAVGVATAGLALAGCTAGSAGGGTSSAPRTVVTQTTTVTPSGASSTPGAGTSPSASGGSSGGPSSGSGSSSGSGGSGGGSGGSGGTIECTPTVSRITWSPLGGASSHDGVDIHVVNASQQPCNTIGYPGVAVLGGSGQQIEQAQRAAHGFLGGLESGDPPQLTLQPGQEATARLEWETATNGGNCPDGHGVLFTLPDNTDSTRLDIEFTTCPDGVEIHPLLAGDVGDSG